MSYKILIKCLNFKFIKLNSDIFNLRDLGCWRNYEEFIKCCTNIVHNSPQFKTSMSSPEAPLFPIDPWHTLP